MCSFISTEFNTFVLGTNDNQLIIFSINNKSLIKKINLNNEIPLKIFISNGWGFIIVYTNLNQFKIYNINGLFINNISFKNKCNFIKPFTCNKGFDYLIIGFETQIKFFEIYFPNNNNQNFDIPNSKILDININFNFKTILILNENLKLFLYNFK